MSQWEAEVNDSITYTQETYVTYAQKRCDKKYILILTYTDVCCMQNIFQDFH